jgi:hypothetical protein
MVSLSSNYFHFPLFWIHSWIIITLMFIYIFFSYLLCDHCILLMRLNYEISIMIQWDLIIFILT